jgi:hypothetical protein
MHVFRLARPLAAGVLAVVLMTAVGCTSSDEKKPDVQQGSAESKQSLPDESAAVTKQLAEEFQQPPVLPPSEPPSKLAASPIDKPTPLDKPASLGNTPAASFVEPAKDEPATLPKKAVAPPRLTKVPRKPFDAVKQNGPIFKDWKKPKAAIAITGMEQGYIEPCGCAGLERMKGGMSRRSSLLQQLRKEGWPLVAVDVGGLTPHHGYGPETEIKFQTLAQSKEKMGYSAVGFGADDLRMPASALVLAAADVDGKPSAFVSANVGLLGFDQHITQTYRVVEAGGLKIGITAILGKTYQKEVNNREVEMCDPETALQKIVPELKRRKADYLILLANATRKESEELARKFPDFKVVVCAEGEELPPDVPEKIPGSKTLLITVGHKGMHVVVLGLYDDRQTPFLYQNVPLDSRFPQSVEMKRLMAAFQEQLKMLGFDKLELHPASHPLAETSGRFVGSKKCESCHEPSYNIWKKSEHAHAYETLEKLDPPRNFDPECVSCHVVGWHPSKFFPYQGGFEGLEKTPHLVNTGCEDCHGPGEKHVQAEIGSDEALQKKYRRAVVVTKEQSKKDFCSTCHDVDNSPDFDFDKYWPLIEHYEKTKE